MGMEGSTGIDIKEWGVPIRYLFLDTRFNSSSSPPKLTTAQCSFEQEKLELELELLGRLLYYTGD